VTFAVIRRKPLVYCEPANRYYARYVGRHCEGAFVAGRELDRFEIESFRTDPLAWIPPEEIDPMTPRAA
jgi:hypothetical protein